MLSQGARARPGLRHGALGHRPTVPVLSTISPGATTARPKPTASPKLPSSISRSSLALSAGAEDAERHLVEALTRRFQEPHGVSPEQFDRWDDDYAAAMRRVHNAFPDDHDIMALLVEALITRTPRRLWDVKTGLPARNADTLEALALGERSVAMTDKAGQRPHLAILHLHIHVMEMSNHPEHALRSADRLSTMAPDAGHMNHIARAYLCAVWRLREGQARERAGDRVRRHVRRLCGARSISTSRHAATTCI